MWSSWGASAGARILGSKVRRRFRSSIGRSSRATRSRATPARRRGTIAVRAILPKATVLVMFVDEEGKIVKQDARELFGVKELDTLTIVGKAKRDKAGNVTVMASKVFVPEEKRRRNDRREVDIKRLAIVREHAGAGRRGSGTS